MAYVVPKLETAKDVVRQMPKKFSFRRTFQKQDGRRGQPQLKSPQQHLNNIYWSLSMQLSWKKYLLVICKLLGLLVNTLTFNVKYSLLNRDNLKQQIQMHLSKKKNFFSIFFYIFEISNKLWAFSKNDDPHSFCFSEITDWKRRG